MVLRTVLFCLLCCGGAYATTLREFQSKSPQDQGRFLSEFVDKMATDISSKNPSLGRSIVIYFSETPAGANRPAGIDALLAEIMKVDALAKQGKADPDKVQIEGMIVYVVKRQFTQS